MEQNHKALLGECQVMPHTEAPLILSYWYEVTFPGARWPVKSVHRGQVHFSSMYALRMQGMSWEFLSSGDQEAPY